MVMKRKLPSKSGTVDVKTTADGASDNGADNQKKTADKKNEPSQNTAQDKAKETADKQAVEETQAAQKNKPSAEPKSSQNEPSDKSEQEQMPPKRRGSPANFSSLDPAAPKGSAAAASIDNDDDWVEIDSADKPKPLEQAPGAYEDSDEVKTADAPVYQEAKQPPKPEKSDTKPWESAASGGDDDSWELGDLVELPDDDEGTPQLDKIPEKPVSSPNEQVRDDPAPSKAVAMPDVPVFGQKQHESPKQPPWKRFKSGGGSGNGNGGSTPPPTLHSTADNASSKQNLFGSMVSLLILGLVIVLGVMFFQNREKAVEMLARWTGTLNRVAQELPEKSTAELEVEAEVAHDALNGGVDITPQGQSRSNVRVDIVEDAEGNAQVQIEQVESEQQTEEELSDFEQLQEALDRKRAENRKESSAKLEPEEEEVDPATVDPADMARRNVDLIESVEDELAAYREALSGSGNPALKPKPGEFFRGDAVKRQRQKPEKPKSPLDEGPVTYGGEPTPPSEPAQAADNQPAQPQTTTRQTREPTLEGRSALGAAQREPAKPQQEEAEPGMRTLSDFTDAMMMEQDRRKVRIPEHIRPRIAASDFPPLTVLSFIPNYGMIGVTNGREGVLLLGETIQGWELINVNSGYAEFRQGNRKKVVTLNDANR